MKTLCWHCDRMAELRDVEEITRGPCAGYTIRRCPFCDKVTHIVRTPGRDALHMRLTRTTSPTPFGEITTDKGQYYLAFILKFGAIPKGSV